MRVLLIMDPKGYPIQPEHINTDPRTGGYFVGAFQNVETEESAHHLVLLAQHRQAGWAPFTREEIQAFVDANGYGGEFSFYRLVNPEHVFANAGKAFEAMAMAGNAISAVLAAATQPKVSVGGGWIVTGDDGMYYYTHDFVVRCFGSSPVLTGLVKAAEPEILQPSY